MIITFSGLPGAGKSSISKSLARKLKLKRYSWGEFFKKEANKRKLDKLKLAELANENKEINYIIDKKLKKLIGKRKDFILDSRLAAKFYKNAFNIYIVAPLELRAKRIAKRDRLNYKEALRRTRLRQRLEVNQYKKQYKFDYTNKKHYDLIVNTKENFKPNHYADKILEKIKLL